MRPLLILALVAAALWLLTAAGWSLVRHRRLTPTTALTFLAGAALTAALGVFLFTDGIDGQVIEGYLRASGLPAASDAAASDGPYAVKTVDYGTEGGLPSGTVNLIRGLGQL